MSDRTSTNLISSGSSTAKMSVGSSNTGGKLLQKSNTILGKLFTRGQKEEPSPPPSRGTESCLDESIYDQLEIKQNPAIRPLHRNAETLQVRDERACLQSHHIPNLRVRSSQPDFITKRLQSIIICVCPTVNDYNTWLEYMQNYAQGCFNLSTPPKPPTIHQENYDYLEAPFPPTEVERNIAIAAICHGPYVQEQRDSLNEMLSQASNEFNTSGAFVSIINQDTDFAESENCVDNIPREQSIAAHALLSNEVMVIADTSKDWRFRHNPNTLEYYRTRFFAGAPMTVPTGEVVGVFWLSSRHPRDTFSMMDRRTLCKYSERAVEVLWKNVPALVETPPITPSIWSTSSPTSSSDPISVDSDVNPSIYQAEISRFPSVAQAISSPFSSSNMVSGDRNTSPRSPPPGVPTQPWNVLNPFSAGQNFPSPRDDPVQKDASSPGIRSRKGRRVRSAVPSSFSPRPRTPSREERPIAMDSSSPILPDPEISTHEKLPIAVDVSTISFSPTHLNIVNRDDHSYAPPVGSSEVHLESSHGTSQTRFYDNMPDSPTLGSTSSLSRELLNLQGCPDIPGLEKFDNIIGFSNQRGMVDHINGYDSQTGKSMPRVSMKEISTNRTDRADISSPMFTDANFALKLWAQALGYNLLYVVELKPMRIGLTDEEIMAPGGMQTPIIVSHGNFPNKNLNVRLHLDALRNKRAIVWSDETKNTYSRGLLMSLDINQFEIQQTATHGLVFGAFRKGRKVQFEGRARPIGISAHSFTEVIKVGHTLKSILSSNFLPSTNSASSRYGRSPTSSVDEMAARRRSTRYPANEAHLVSDESTNTGSIGFSLDQVSAALKHNTSIS